MSLWSKVKKAISVAVEIAPVLPIPAKAKKVVAGVGKVEADVEAVIADVKPPKPAA